jgi:hypothetical protein
MTTRRPTARSSYARHQMHPRSATARASDPPPVDQRAADLAFLETVRTADMQTLARMLGDELGPKSEAWKRAAIQRAIGKKIDSL